MNRLRYIILSSMTLAVSVCSMAQSQSDGDFPPPRQNYTIQTPTYLSDYFEVSDAAEITPGRSGFIRRWSVLEPISKPNRSNTVFTDTYLNHVLDSVYYKNQFAVVPKNGDKVKVAGKKLAWYSLDSKLDNYKLYRFAAALKQPVYGVIFHAVTVINCQDDIENVRLSAGSNSASKWWLNGAEVLMLSGDRRMVADDAVSKRLTLKKGKNVLRCAVINGPGMSDFCARFVDENGTPINNFTVSYQ